MNPSSENPGMPRLNFPPVRLRARRRGDAVEVWDGLRGIYLLLTPEEWVRQHLIAYLVSACGVQAKRIVEEYAVALNGQPQRADVVVVGDWAEPLLLAECKAPDIPLGERTLAQAVRYNSVLGARWIVLTNGLRHYCWELRDGRYEQLSGFPNLAADL
ncbi:MAG: type I restriction enzyme HsdR N-terminal domain-containing protein [Alistipes sp.]|nr:type I restriction enzyme HsdR N-terminal domain-containing protein [Alistipes senegalensis]MCM1249989.1 type I restriction enzyme HsdR N-terminal domain-containing protein [Alistipes sp.]